MTGAEYVTGAAVLGIVIGSAGWAGWLLVRRRGEALTGAARALAIATLACLLVFAAHLIPGALGILDRGTVAACSVALLAGASLVASRLGPGRGAPPPPGPGPATRASHWLALAAAGAVGVYALAHVGGHFDEGTLQSDAATFHLNNIAEWIQRGSFWIVDDFVYDRAAGNYPQTGDVFMLAAVLPFEYDFLVRLVGWPFTGLLALALYAGARELAAPRSTAVLVAAAVVAMPAVIYIAPVGLGDPEMLGLYGAGGYFLLRHWRTRDGFDLALAGVGLGLSLGTRWYAVFAVGAALAVWVGALLLARRRARRAAAPDGPRQRAPASAAAVLGALALVAACGGFWFLRNFVESGNPAFPVRVAPFGIELFSAPGDPIRDVYGFTLADYFGRPGIYRDAIIPEFLDFMGAVAVALWIGIAVAAVAGLRRLRALGDGLAGRAVALAACAALIGIAYVVTPYTAAGPENDPSGAAVNARYVIPALVAGAPAVAWIVARAGGRPRIVIEALLGLLVLDALVRASGQPGGEVGRGSVLAAAVLVLPGYLLWPRLRALAPRLVSTRARLAGTVAAGAFALLVAGAAIEAGFNSKRYVGINPPIDFVNARAPARHSVGLVGEGWVSYPMYGPRLENEVEAIARRVDEMLRAYPDRRGFTEAVRQADYDLILVTEIDSLDPERPLRQERWLAGLPYVEVAAGGHPIAPAVDVRLYARRGTDLAEGATEAAGEAGAGDAPRAAPGPVGGTQ